MLMLEMSLIPLGKGESVSKNVAEILAMIDKSGVSYRVNPMGTVLEGEWDEVFGVVKACFDKMKADGSRVTATIKLDYRPGSESRLSSKIASVEKHLGRKLNQ